MDISNLSLQELKVLAYDTLAYIQYQQANLELINRRIAELSKESKPIEEAEKPE